MRRRKLMAEPGIAWYVARLHREPVTCSPPPTYPGVWSDIFEWRGLGLDYGGIERALEPSPASRRCPPIVIRSSEERRVTVSRT